ncbi:uncharacterized protein [Onthophagus taurus]|uniref:uncharacterized protein n=1 Tax=Onthophagus taurus TaxID=166361 RepID=UPI0039BEBA12
MIFGNPEHIVADRGTAFTAERFRAYCRDENVQLTHITTGVPRANGQVERINRIIIPILTKLTVNDESTWFKHVGKVQLFLNKTDQRSIRTSPGEILFGVFLKHKDDIRLKEIIEDEYLKTFVETREESRKLAKKNILKIQDENRKQFNKKRKSSTQYKCGDLIVIKRTQFVNCGKFKSKFLGPYKIVTVKNHDRYDVERFGMTEGPKKWPKEGHSDERCIFDHQRFSAFNMFKYIRVDVKKN